MAATAAMCGLAARMSVDGCTIQSVADRNDLAFRRRQYAFLYRTFLGARLSGHPKYIKSLEGGFEKKWNASYRDKGCAVWQKFGALEGQVKPKDMVIFPSWLEAMTNSQTTARKRKMDLKLKLNLAGEQASMMKDESSDAKLRWWRQAGGGRVPLFWHNIKQQWPYLMLFRATPILAWRTEQAGQAGKERHKKELASRISRMVDRGGCAGGWTGTTDGCYL
ncbi:uncharacterized protein B0T23DRAFT_306108 [Neurospora hispaniola]|uniref:Uncharacterized protein n=1 Tax=Neurospora hispaniola TaxID=588809 RepID=A0AAJ0IGN6_9PEZI|nr:hypothetical protein B0T23DRAFT_306108 [Neurospora hispaniola]